MLPSCSRTTSKQRSLLHLQHLSRVTVVFGAALVSAIAGCSSLGGEKDAVEIARLVTQYRKRGRALLNEITDEQRRNPGAKPLIAYVDKMKEAARYFGEAVSLADTSSEPRFEYARALQLVGNNYFNEYRAAKAEIAQCKVDGRPLSKDVLKKRDQNWASAAEYLHLSNREYQYYINYIHARAPKPEVYNELRANFEVLQMWDEAAQVTRLLLAETRGTLKPELEADFRKMLNAYDDKVREGAVPERP